VSLTFFGISPSRSFFLRSMTSEDSAITTELSMRVKWWWPLFSVPATALHLLRQKFFFVDVSFLPSGGRPSDGQQTFSFGVAPRSTARLPVALWIFNEEASPIVLARRWSREDVFHRLFVPPGFSSKISVMLARTFSHPGTFFPFLSLSKTLFPVCRQTSILFRGFL